tara:strand:+ start:456 stop:1040 length:585 start_codon:yes stop_codon:yes gene_type:complete
MGIAPVTGLMKKYFPILAFITMFTGFLAGQVFFDVFESSAGQSSAQKKVYGHYEDLLKKSVFVTTEGKTIAGNAVSAPVVILNFWATWCKPCLEEFPSLVEFDQKYSDDKVLIIGINTDDESAKKDVIKTIKKYNMTFSNVEDVDGSWLEKFMITAIPVSIIFHNGEVIEVSNGAKDFMSGEFQEKIDGLLKLN